MQMLIKSVPSRVIEDVTVTFGSDEWIAFTINGEDPDGELRDVFVNDNIVTLKVLKHKIRLCFDGLVADIGEYDFRKVEIV